MDDRTRLVAAGYDEIAVQYAALERPEQEWPRLRLLHDLLRRLEGPSRILDLGCGNGLPALREIVREHAGVGVDISRTQLALAKGNVPSAELLHADALELELPPRSFDAVVAFYLLDHLPREEHASLFAKLYTWLSAGGFLLFSVEPSEEPGYVRGWPGTPMFFSCFDAETTISIVRAQGFEILASHTEIQIEGAKEVEFLLVLARRPV